ncbi:hypothetical protein CHCC15337_3665 [Bacillus paralicheniformis]|nr:hypothetical protein CHCC5021_3147 [Bacillus paralicheniformis]TWL14687.1 hypothetical protein CHCC19467_2585 [Bacillus paralicheniformis]TWL45897.1 hypothetical protein CHCC15337_3665 [Bacillus paralicheniformis]TWM31327.1 hypothetical protein CHCC14821_1471 [Bacillus paralicheniformis]TWN40488.1 hypothetical protein CHCC14527_1176 [Bacillus paralicheniformis]
MLQRRQNPKTVERFRILSHFTAFEAVFFMLRSKRFFVLHMF